MRVFKDFKTLLILNILKKLIFKKKVSRVSCYYQLIIYYHATKFASKNEIDAKICFTHSISYSPYRVYKQIDLILLNIM